MSQENLAVVRQAIVAINERDAEGYLALCTADWELVTPMSELEQSLRGPEGVRSFFSGIEEIMSGFCIDVERLEEIGDARVLALATARTTSRTSAVPFEVAVANVYELVDGKLHRVHVYRDRNEALEAVGLRE